MNKFSNIFLSCITRISVLDYSREREELRLRCQEKKLQRQIDVIRGALNELGCEELPSGCDLSMEGSFTDSPAISKVSKKYFPFFFINKK
jgi:hypothetical protein